MHTESLTTCSGHAPLLCRHSQGCARDGILRLGGQREAIVAGGVGIESHFPEFIESPAGADVAKRQDILGSRYAPEHARLFAARADDGFTAGFDDPRTDEEAAAAEGAILHALDVADEITQFLFHRFGSGGAGAFLARRRDELFDLIP